MTGTRPTVAEVKAFRAELERYRIALGHRPRTLAGWWFWLHRCSPLARWWRVE
jgi:hypothetical protein